MSILVAECPWEASVAEQRHTAQRLLRLGLERAFGVRPGEVELELNSWGKPLLRGHPGMYFNVAHCRRAVAVLFADCPVGVDVASLRCRDALVAARCLDAAESERVEAAADPDREFFRYWTLKESYVKALGCGLSYPVRGVRFEVFRDREIGSNRPWAAFRLIEEFAAVVIALCWLRQGGRPKDSELVQVEW